MGYYVQQLEPGTLYLTMSVAHQPSSYRPSYSQDTAAYLFDNLSPNDPRNSRSITAQLDVVEEFQWGLYYHRRLRDGTWYTLQRTIATPGEVIPGITHPIFQLVREDVEESPRLDFSVVGLVRGLAVSEDACKALTSYLDWLTLRTAMKAQCTFMWATSVFFRTRKHVLKTQRHGDTPELDVETLLREALEFAYEEVWYTLGRQLPRPILAPSRICEISTREPGISSERVKRVEAELEKEAKDRKP